MIGLSPLLPDDPDIISYPGIMMHLVVPIVAVMSFLLNDPPFGKPKLNEPLKGMLLLAAYGIVMMYFFGSGILPSEKAPYSFLDFEKTSILFKIACFAVIFAIGYFVSWVLMRLNMKLSWIWFYDRKRRKKRG